MKITYFCSSSDELSPVFYSESAEIGRALSHHHLIYGGSNLGIMGAVAAASIQNKGRVTGIITQGLNTNSNQQSGLDDLIICSNLNERKKLLVEMADLFLVLPGGFGTLDEALDVLASKQVGELDKPIVFYNCFGFWDGFFEFSGNLFEQKMVLQDLSALYSIVNNVEELTQEIDKLSARF